MAITRNLVVMLKDDVAKPKEKMFVYRDDVGVEMVIELKDFDYSIDTVGNRNNIQKAYALFRTPTKKTYQYTNIKISNGKLVFTFSQDIVNVMQEIGEYELQFQLYDKEDNRLTIPSYNFYVKEPLTIDGELVDTAVVDESVIVDLGEEKDYIFVITDGYIKTKWRTGDLITKERLNKVENALSVITDAVNSKVGISQLHNHENKEILDTISVNKINEWNNKSNFNGDYNSLTSKPTIPTKVSDLQNDSGYLTEHQDISGKVDKRNGYSLIKNEEIDRLATLKNYDDSEVKETLTVIKEDIEDLKNAEIDLSDYATLSDLENYVETSELDNYATLSDLENYVEISDLDNYVGNSSHSHSNMAVLDTITNELTTKWNKAIPFEDSCVDSANHWLTNGYTKTSTSTSNLPSVCTGGDRWGVLFFLAENSANGTGTQMYFPIDGTYKGRVFTRSIVNRTNISSWFLLSTFDGDYNNLTNKPASLPANGGNASTVGGYSLWVGTQAQYDAINPKLDTTIYIIKEG